MMRISLIITALALCLSTNAQSLKELFLRMPTEVCPLLSEYNRLEIVDNQKNEKVMQTTNVMKTVSEMKTLTDTFARLKVTKNSEKTMKLLPCANGEQVIAVVSTVFIDNTPDSHIEFYDTAWKKLNATNMIDFEQIKGFHYIELKSDTDDLRVVSANPLSVTLNGSNDFPKIHTSVMTLRWNGEKYEVQ